MIRMNGGDDILDSQGNFIQALSGSKREYAVTLNNGSGSHSSHHISRSSYCSYSPQSINLPGNTQEASMDSFVGDIVGSSVYKFSDDGNHEISGQYLMLKSIPDPFTNRYKINFDEKPIYIRRCYMELYEIATQGLIESKNEYCAIIFTGVPGIGKSMFLIYFIFRYLSDSRFADKRFAVELEKAGNYNYFTTSDDGSLIWSSVKDTQLPRDVHVFTDMTAIDEPGRHGKSTLVFCSPDNMRYKQTLKFSRSFKYILPTWSYEELLFIDSVDENWLNSFITYGGVPRSIFSSRRDLLLDEAMDSAGSVVAKNIFDHGLGGRDSDMNYMLIHINPPTVLDGVIKYDQRPIFSFASDTIFKSLADKHKTDILNQTATIFNRGVAPQVLGGCTAGLYFEKLLLWLEPIAGQNIEMRALLNAPSMAESLHYKLPPMELLEYKWNTLAKESENHLLRPGVFYQPQICNLESGDAFCVIEEDVNKYTLIVLQITVAQSHPVRVNGLNAIVSSYSQNIQNNMHKKLLVFVTPVGGNLSGIQSLTGQQGQVMATNNIPLLVRNFQQYICIRPIPTLSGK